MQAVESMTQEELADVLGVGRELAVKIRDAARNILKILRPDLVGG
jgi:hypothetical protein